MFIQGTCRILYKEYIKAYIHKQIVGIWSSEVGPIVKTPKDKDMM